MFFFLVFVSAATYQQEFPYAVYCYPERRVCYGSLYGVAWTQHSDRVSNICSINYYKIVGKNMIVLIKYVLIIFHNIQLRQMKSGESSTLFDHFNHVRGNIPFTHVALFGDMKLGSNKLKEFIGYKHVGKETNTQKLGQANSYYIKNHIEKMNKNLSYFACSHRIATESNNENDKINEVCICKVWLS